MSLGNRVFIRKTSGFNLYKWSPQPNNFNKKPLEVDNKRPYFCDARPNTQGQDCITTYSYNINLINGKQERTAYVACDYVV